MQFVLMGDALCNEHATCVLPDVITFWKRVSEAFIFLNDERFLQRGKGVRQLSHLWWKEFDYITDCNKYRFCNLTMVL